LPAQLVSVPCQYAAETGRDPKPEQSGVFRAQAECLRSTAPCASTGERHCCTAGCAGCGADMTDWSSALCALHSPPCIQQHIPCFSAPPGNGASVHLSICPCLNVLSRGQALSPALAHLNPILPLSLDPSLLPFPLKTVRSWQ